jgi:preprotein translocase subunit SecE
MKRGQGAATPLRVGRALAASCVVFGRFETVAKASENGGGIGGFVRSVPEFIQQVRAETGKVSWPTRRETMMTAVMVVIMTALLSIFFLGVDSAFNALAQALLKLVS